MFIWQQMFYGSHPKSNGMANKKYLEIWNKVHGVEAPPSSNQHKKHTKRTFGPAYILVNYTKAKYAGIFYVFCAFLIVASCIRIFMKSGYNPSYIAQMYKNDGKFDEIYYGYGLEDPKDVPPQRNRIPRDAVKYTTDLFSLEQVKHALKVEKDPDVVAACQGPKNNVDIWMNEERMFNDLMMMEDVDALTAFCLDCRLPSTHHIAFLTVMGSKGNIVAMRQIPRRAESINLKNTTTLLASTQRGVMEWNWETDTLVDLGFYADTHTLVYRETENRYYGCFPDKQAVDLHNPNTVCTFDGDSHLTILNDPDRQTTGWAWADLDAHMNYITVGDDAVYISERSLSAMKKVSMKTNQIEWVLGGKHNTFTVYDAQGQKVEIEGKANLPWNHQHKFQHLDDNWVSCFDNNVGLDHQFLEQPWGKDSRMLLLYIDQESKTAYEMFSYPVGDRARSYGGTDILPSGNLLGSSYVDWVFPSNEDYQYHQNIWEVSPDKEVVWRVGFKGLNIVNPKDNVNPYPHHFRVLNNPNADIMSVGWNIYNAERLYQRPVFSRPCQIVTAAGMVLVFMPFNTIRSQEDYPGVAYLSRSGTSDYLDMKQFMFHKSWLPRPLVLQVPAGDEATPLTITVVNHWQDFSKIDVGMPVQMNECPDKDPYRVFFPAK